MKSQMDVSQAAKEVNQGQTEAKNQKMHAVIKSGQEEIKATMSASQGKMEAAISSIKFDLVETIKNRVENACCPSTIGDRISASTEETQLGLRAVTKDLHAELDFRNVQTQNDTGRS
jgi:hypothetical protein